MSAIFGGKDNEYRYQLTREWGDGPRVLWVMLNPSTADAEKDDPTIRRCIGFSKAWGYGGLTVCNLFAFRATDPKKLRGVIDPIGPENDRHIFEASSVADMTIAAWGGNGHLMDRATYVGRRLTRPHALNVIACGCPVHPLYQPKHLRPSEWTP